jgi:hypothetical protein
MRRTLFVFVAAASLVTSGLMGGVASAQATAIDAEPEEETHVINSGHTIVALATDAGGDPVAGEPVSWTTSGTGLIEQADAVTDADGFARALLNSPIPGDQVVTVFLGAVPPPTCDEATGTCDATLTHWVDRQPGNTALQCSGGAQGINGDLGTFGDVPASNEPCPTAGSPEDPTTVEDTALIVVAHAERTFSSTGAHAEASAVNVNVGGFIIDVLGARSDSTCDERGIANQSLDSGIITIRSASTGAIIFDGSPPPNTSLGILVLNQQSSTVGPALPNEPQARHAEGFVNAVNVLGGTVIIGHAETDVTCKQHTFRIGIAPATATNPVNTNHTVVASVTDEAGRRVVGEPVSWSLTGVGSFVSAETVTDDNGQAEAVTTSPDPGSQTITASLSDTETKCTEPGGVCSASAEKTWIAGPPPITSVTVFGHAHENFDDPATNDVEAVHIEVNGPVQDTDINDATPPTGKDFGAVIYEDSRKPPGGIAPATDKCRANDEDLVSITASAANTITINGSIRCFAFPGLETFSLTITDNGANPPNGDGYSMVITNVATNTVVYSQSGTTTVGGGDLTVVTA